MFSIKLKNWNVALFMVLASGIVVAVVISIMMGLLGFSVSVETVYWLWGITLLLSLFKIRFLSVSYSAGIVILLHLIASSFSDINLPGVMQRIWDSLLMVDSTGILVIAALLHIAEAILVRLQGEKLANPVYVAGKRGKVIGGYVIQSYWVIPLFLFMPVTNTTQGAFIFDEAIGHPFFLTPSIEAWLLLACPMMIGVTEISKSLIPLEAVKALTKKLFIFGVILLLFALATWWFSFLIPVAATLTLISHELLLWLNRWRESNAAPIFTTQNNGVKILAIIEKSPAEELGLKAGEVLHKVNGQYVQSLNQVFEAMSSNPAFCKLEVLNVAGEVKFVQRARYADEHHQLGIVFSPEETVLHYGNYFQPSILSLLGKSKLKTKVKSSISSNEKNSATI